MESNISRDHIALEAFKIMLEKGICKKQSFWNKIAEFFGGDFKEKINLPNDESLVRNAYRYADAMIAEREKDNGGRQKEA